jgi:hypothetical protein
MLINTVRATNATLNVPTRPTSPNGRTGPSGPGHIPDREAELTNNTTNNAALDALNLKPSTIGVPTLAHTVPGMAGMSSGLLDDYGMDYSAANYEVFDPLNWMLDGTVEFPFNFNQIVAEGMGGDVMGGGEGLGGLERVDGGL